MKDGGMKKANFTAERVDAFKCNEGRQQTIYWDAKTPGLGLRVTTSGKKSYVFEARLHGKTLRLTIGDIKTWSIGRAQKKATEYKTLTDQGVDPRQVAAEKREKAEAEKLEKRRHAVTLEQAWAAYVEANESEWGDQHRQDHVRIASKGGATKKRGAGLTVPGPLAPLLPLPLSEIDKETVKGWLRGQSAKRPTSAAHAYRLLRAFIRWANGKAEYRGLVPHEAYSATEVRKSLAKSKPKDDCLQREQLPSWFAGVREIHNPVISVYLQALLLTGARREELAGLQWSDVDFKWRSLKIRDKVAGSRMIPLTPYLANLLWVLKQRNDTPPTVRQLSRMEKLRKPSWKPSRWVFSSPTSASGRLAEPRIAHNEVLIAAGLPHITLHGLRRSFGTLCEWVEMPSGISAQIMGHKPSALAEKHYRRRPLDLLRMWHDKIEVWILEQAEIQFEAPQQHGLRAVKS